LTRESNVSLRSAVLFFVASLLLLTWLAVALRYEAIESGLRERVTQTLAAYAIKDVSVDVDGRDIRLAGTLSGELEPGYVAALAGEVWGVREVDTEGLMQSAELRVRNDPLVPRVDRERIVRLGGNLANPLDAATCQRMMARLASVSSVRFEQDGASPMPESYQVLNDLAAIAYQCPESRLVIGGHTDTAGDRDFRLRLSRARAEAVERFFYHAGIPAERMQIVNFGDSQPIASNSSAAGRAANRRITFDVLPLQ
jgi:outer membrane protein OmpA-like peptidoglycan-associated protein